MSDRESLKADAENDKLAIHEELYGEPRTKKGYDEKCYELAMHFQDESAGKDLGELAQVIQDAIEDWLNED